MEDNSIPTETRVEKLVKKRKKVKWVLVVSIFCLLAFAAGYLFTTSDMGNNAADSFRSWFSNEDENVLPPGDNDEDQPPDEQKDPPGEEPKDPEDQTDLPDKENGADPEDPIIYAGQQLIIALPQGSGSTITEAQVVQSGTLDSSAKRIALTFDSGWLYEQTIPLLNVLDKYSVTATFFPRAYWIHDHPNLGREIVKRGHTMGNHSLTHPHMNKLTVEQLHYEMQESTRIIQEVTGVRPYLFRPPYGEYDQRLLKVLAEEGYPYSIMWTIDTLDWAAGTTRNVGGKQTYIDEDFIVNRVLNNASNNGIVLMHIGGADTVSALPRIIKGLQNMGYEFATVDEMLPPPGSGAVTHTVKSGETLFSISQRYGISVQQIINQNDL